MKESFLYESSCHSDCRQHRGFSGAQCSQDQLYGSQGQCRSSILALKISELYNIKDITGDYPILLLDDIFSELDIEKRNRLIKYIIDDVQTIITTTDLNMIDSSLVKNAKIFNVSDGKINVLEKEGKRHE